MWPFNRTPNTNDEALKTEFEKAKSRMQPFRIIGKGDGFEVVISVCQIVNNGDGKIGILVARGYHTSAIHEIIGNGSFSKKGPFWTKKTWSCTPNRFAVCKLAVSTSSAGLKNPKEQIRTYGLSVLEMNTDQLPQMEFNDWRSVFHR